MKSKTCSKCAVYKTLNLFSKSNQSPDKHQYWCKQCVSENSIAFYKKKNEDPEFRKKQSIKSIAIKKKRPEVYKNSELLRKYGISLTEYNQMIALQDGQCGICNMTLSKPTVDHCHKTGKVRKILCYRCNNLLGQARDNTDILHSAISYLEEFSK